MNECMNAAGITRRTEGPDRPWRHSEGAVKMGVIRGHQTSGGGKIAVRPGRR